MKKLVLLVGSLLAVSAVASAKEVVPKPKAAPEVQVKEVIKEVPVEKIVYQDKIVEVPKVGPKGTFEVSYKVPFYGFGFGGSLKDTKDSMPGFTEIQRVGELATKAEVEVAPKHKVRAEAKAALELIPHKSYDDGDATKKSAMDTAKADLDKAKEALDKKPTDNDAEKKAVEDAEKKYNEAKKAWQDTRKEKTVAATEASIKEMKVGYNYAHSDLVSIDGEFALERTTIEVPTVVKGDTPDKDKVVLVDKDVTLKSVKVAPTFDVKSYFFENDYVKAKEISLTPAYKYTWMSIPSNNDSMHTLSLSGAAKFEGPYATEVGLDLEDFVKADIMRVERTVEKDGKQEKETKTETVVTGNAGIYAKKGFGLYENGNHNVNLDVKAGYQLKDFAWSDNAKVKVKDKDVRLNTDKLYVKPELTYTYKINDYSKVYTTLGAEVAGKKNYREEDAKRSWALGSDVKAGLKVEF